MRVTTKGQVTIPKEVRDALGIKPGSEVDFILEDGDARLVRAQDRSGESRAERMVRRFRDAAKRLKVREEFAGMSSDEYMDLIRGRRDDINSR